MKTIKSVLSSLQRAPLKSFLTLFTVGLGVGVLIFALSISQTFSARIKAELEGGGLILYLANAAYSEEEGMEPVRPPQFDENLIPVLTQSLSGVQSVAPISNPFWNEFIVGQEVFRVRTVIASDAGYAGVTGMQFTAGSYFSAEDIEKGSKKAVISTTLAELLFGSAEQALGKTLRPPAPNFGGDNTGNTQGGNNSTSNTEGAGNRNNKNNRRGQLARFSPPTYTISGVFEDFSELKRTSYGLGDMVLPYTSIFPAEMNRQMARLFMQSTVALNVKGVEFSRVEAQLRDVLSREYGEDVKIHLWEGTPQGQANVLEETRQSIGTFALVVNLLGFLLLVTGSIGILSIMLVEVLGKTRDIALERSLGASKSIIIKEYFIRSLVMTSASVILGIILSFIFSQPLKQIILPIFRTMGDTVTAGGVITPLAIFIGGASSLFIGGVFGILPLLSALQTNICEGLREV